MICKVIYLYIVSNIIYFCNFQVWLPDVEVLNLKEFKSLDVLDKLQGTIHILRKHLWGGRGQKIAIFAYRAITKFSDT